MVDAKKAALAYALSILEINPLDHNVQAVRLVAAPIAFEAGLESTGELDPVSLHEVMSEITRADDSFVLHYTPTKLMSTLIPHIFEAGRAYTASVLARNAESVGPGRRERYATIIHDALSGSQQAGTGYAYPTDSEYAAADAMIAHLNSAGK